MGTRCTVPVLPIPGRNWVSTVNVPVVGGQSITTVELLRLLLDLCDTDVANV